MMSAITAPQNNAFAAMLNQATKGLVKTKTADDFVRIDNTLPGAQNNFNGEVKKAIDNVSQSRADIQQRRRTAMVGINHRQHQQDMIDIYLSFASNEQKKQANPVSYSDLIALSDSVKLNRLVSSAAEFESVQGGRNALQEKYQHIIRPQPEPVMRVQA